MSSVAVIDYGMGNLHSIAKALHHAAPKYNVQVTSEPESILNAERVVFPGVGAIRDCMLAIRQTGLLDVIKEAARSKPFLGICLGMQALLTDNEENGHTETLNIISGHVVRFPGNLPNPAGGFLKIPHMGWNQVHQKQHPLWEGIPQNSRYYFVHSYFAKPDSAAVVAGQSDYSLTFTSAIAQKNVFAVQFHPEKSQRAGLQLLANFLHWDGAL